MGTRTADELLRELAKTIDRHCVEEGIIPMPIEGLTFIRTSNDTLPMPTVYWPSLCVIAQGRKEVMLGEKVYRYQSGQSLVVSVDLPVTGRVINATPDSPYLCFMLSLRPEILSELVAKMELLPNPKSSELGLGVNKIDSELLEPILKLANLLDKAGEISVMAPLIVQEIHYRLLTSGQKEIVRQIATSGSNAQRIAQIITYLKSNLAKPLSVEALAKRARMSVSSFHSHFKDVTAMSPLQYQKNLRLIEARRQMLAGLSDATNAAYNVGYESPSQFSREYSRMFGEPPMRDIERLRESA